MKILLGEEAYILMLLMRYLELLGHLSSWILILDPNLEGIILTLLASESSSGGHGKY